MPMCNLIEYSDNYSDTSGSLWQFKRDEITNNADVTNDNAPSFKYKANLIGNTEANGAKYGVKLAVPLKYLNNFWRSLEIPLTNCKVPLTLMVVLFFISYFFVIITVIMIMIIIIIINGKCKSLNILK